jgi:hypothetical protein
MTHTTTQPERANLLTPRRIAALHGFVQWMGEAAIGLIPWAVWFATHRFAILPTLATCGTNEAGLYNCVPVVESPSPEICILAVVISGLAVLSVGRLGRQRERQFTVFTYILMTLALLSLIFGSLFYALFTAHMAKNAADTITYGILAVALLSSVSLALEGAILAA